MKPNITCIVLIFHSVCYNVKCYAETMFFCKMLVKLKMFSVDCKILCKIL